MSRKNAKRRPEVEPLESMKLLSTMTPALPHPLALMGTEHGSYKLKGTNSDTTASGTISPLGKVKDSAVVSGVTGLGNVTMTAKQGKLYIQLKLRPTGGGAYQGTYTITGGTKALAGESGAGKVQVVSSDSGKKGSYSITYD